MPLADAAANLSRYRLPGLGPAGHHEPSAWRQALARQEAIVDQEEQEHDRAMRAARAIWEIHRLSGRSYSYQRTALGHARIHA